MKVGEQDLYNQLTKDMVLFFDLDGTLVDTDYANYLSFKMAIQSVINPKQIPPFNKNERFNRSILLREFPNLNDKDFQEIIKLKERYYAENIGRTTLIPQATEILNNFFELNTTVLVTNCREDRALITLMQHGLINKFTHKIFRKSMQKNQHVNKFENALITLDLQPQRVIAFENEQFEIDEAVKAGIPIENILSV
jgi:beta-phosphoglucomutase